ncbi:MAG TPA: carboxypeptidase regulatory-like domain-containing protein [Terriglobales bacterium]|nr:carboxypeptidase regulatory-like domain-containing protein [Terriglobales bacterium]
MFTRVSWVTLFLTLALALILSTPLVAQSLISGDIAGTISDPTGAVVPNATVNLRGVDTGSTQTTTTNQSGAYRFTLLKPGEYRVSVSVGGFQKMERAITVDVGKMATADMTLQVGSATETVEVSGEAQVVSTEPSVNIAFTPAEVAQLPSPGSDLTNIAQTVAGVVVNVTGGYGNFTINGLPATSNLFTVNGENDMDPYFNINNSGASNLTIGQNEIEEATVIANPYAGQYGQLSGAQVTYVTKSGTNDFHGNALYWWNGRYMNANNWFNNSVGRNPDGSQVAPRPFSNANQWAGRIGGPIRKDKTFFFVDTEGLRFVLPNVYTNTIPTPAFANAVLANVQNLQPAEASTYQKMFSLWQNAPNAASAVPLPNTTACNSLSLPGFDPSTQACAATFRNSANGLGSEWILAARVDQKIGDNDNAYFRYKLDHGLQPTDLSPISKDFYALSNQPAYDMQFSETHVFGPRSTNQFLATFSHYVAQFSQGPQALATFPYRIITAGTVPFTGFNPVTSFPQGRNITQYQFVDDYTLIRGKHNLKFGANYRRYDVSDHNFFFNSPGIYFGYVASGLQKFADGRAYQYRKTLNESSDVPVALWGLGVYAHDEWRVASGLTVTMALRVERNSNPVCQFNCFANFKGPWTGLASVTAADPSTVPYSSDIAYGLHQAYPGVDSAVWSPRIGFSWSPTKSNKTVISGGFGIFYDNPAAGLVDNLLANPPVSVAIRVHPSAGTLPFDPNGGALVWSQSAAAFDITKTYSQLASELHALGAAFNPPALTALVGTIKAPMWKEWNIQVQRQLTRTLVLVGNYVGNQGTRIPYNNAWPNAFDAYGLYPGVAGISPSPKVPNYGTVTVTQSGAISNYNGLSITVRKTFSHWISGLANYTWSHNLDENSNGGIFTYGDSLLGQINPLNLRADNYGNSDYDIRHSFNAGWIVDPEFHSNNRFMKGLLNGWQWSGKWFWRSGLPFSVTDGNVSGYILNGGGTILATPLGGKVQPGGACGHANTMDANGNGTPCLSANAFLNTGAASFSNFTAWSPQTRNQFRGPHLFDIDMALYKNIKFGETRSIGIGVQAFNVFNHPNFGQPDSGLGDPTFGLISNMVSVPTSPYGNFLGFDASPRVVQLSAKLTF